MDSKEIKNALKEARDAIKNKDYASASKISKNLLKSDKQNYMALVFLGISLQEVGPRDQAPFAFRKAIQVSPDQALAWNGLANFYDKDESESASKELIPVYEKLLNLESDASKFSDICSKLVIRALKVQEISKCAEILKNAVSYSNITENNSRTAWLALASLLTQVNNLPMELMLLLEITLSNIVKERTSVTCDYYKEYLKLLYKLKKYDILFQEAVNMQLIYETNIYPLEWICKIYVESIIENNSIVRKFENDVEHYCSKLMKLQENSVMVIFTNAVKLFSNKNYIEARDELKKVVALRAGLTHAWILLSECLLKLYCYNEAAQAAIRSDRLLQSLSKENSILRQKLDYILTCSLSRYTNDSEKWKQAINIGEKIIEQHCNDEDILKSITIAYINLGNYEDAENYLQNIKNVADIKLLTGKLLHKQGNLNKAIAVLTEEIIDNCEIYLEMGILYWNLKEIDLSLVPFLKAAKLDPSCYMCFVYLGRYYDQSKDIEKARRCYQKAFKINPQCLEAGVGLSSVFRKQKNWSANLELLQSVTSNSSAKNPDVRWAWLQLGLHYLEQEEYNNAIECLRSVIRAEPNNGHYWECLADAYMARGAYTAALKSYERATELSDDVLYPKLQVATIKLMLGLHAEAKIDFENILQENGRYVPALKGLAENCLNLAFLQRKNQLLGLCRDNAQIAINQLTIALRERGDLSCLWKLTGDSCFLVANLPTKYCYLLVHSSLVEGKNTDEIVPIDQIQLFTLAARCYCKAINVTQTNTLLWHDLAMCYYAHGCCVEDLEQRKQLFHHALMIAKYYVTNNSSNWQHWNLIGVIALHKDMKKYNLAQHAFIKVVTLEHNSAVGWCNLGTLYLLLNNVHLANKAYSQAQRADPSYVNSWVGQGLIAETMGHDEEAMDLFRHSTQLGYQSQGALGYAHWVCRTVKEAPPHAVIYNIHNMHAVPISCDALTWYIENNSGNACAWNMLGMLRERLGLRTSTLAAFKKALKLTDSENLDKVLINIGRLYFKLEQYNESIQTYQQVQEACFNSGSGLALTLFKAKRYQESYEFYDTTMNWLADNENLQSHVLVALATMAYMFKGPEEAKTLLFQSTQLKPPSQWGLYALLALGLLHGDLALANLVIKELQPMKDKLEMLYHYSVLICLTHLREGNVKAAIRSLTKSIHSHPDQASLWHFLSILLLKVDAKNKAAVAAKCALVSMKMGRSQMDVTKVLCIVSLATCLSKDWKKALSAAQKAVHCYPDVAEGWSVLITTLSYLKNSGKSAWSRQNEWLDSVKKHVSQYLNPSADLNEWLTCVS